MPKNNTPITMKDIARELNVSVATVSRALKGNPRISENTRNKITAYAREHNFSPNLMAEESQEPEDDQDLVNEDEQEVDEV